MEEERGFYEVGHIGGSKKDPPCSLCLLSELYGYFTATWRYVLFFVDDQWLIMLTTEDTKDAQRSRRKVAFDFEANPRVLFTQDPIEFQVQVVMPPSNDLLLQDPHFT